MARRSGAGPPGDSRGHDPSQGPPGGSRAGKGMRGAGSAGTSAAQGPEAAAPPSGAGSAAHAGRGGDPLRFAGTMAVVAAGLTPIVWIMLLASAGTGGPWATLLLVLAVALPIVAIGNAYVSRNPVLPGTIAYALAVAALVAGLAMVGSMLLLVFMFMLVVLMCSANQQQGGGGGGCGDCGCGDCDCGCGDCDCCGDCGGCDCDCDCGCAAGEIGPALAGAGMVAAPAAVRPSAWSVWSQRLAHHPDLPRYAQDVYRVGGARLCIGCFTTYPLFLATAMGLAWAALPVAWAGWMVAGGALILAQVVSTAGWARWRWLKGVVKACLGIGMGMLVHGALAAPWPVAAQVAFLWSLVVLAALSALPRRLRMRRACACPAR